MTSISEINRCRSKLSRCSIIALLLIDLPHALLLVQHQVVLGLLERRLPLFEGAGVLVGLVGGVRPRLPALVEGTKQPGLCVCRGGGFQLAERPLKVAAVQVRLAPAFARYGLLDGLLLVAQAALRGVDAPR